MSNLFGLKTSGGIKMNAIEELKAMRDVWKGFKFNPLDGLHTLRLNEYAVRNTINILDEAIVALEKQEKQLYCAYEQGYEGLDFYGFFLNDKEALSGLKKEIKNSYTCDSEYRFFKLDFSKEGISTSLPVKEVREVLENDC